ncbi:radical SAM protein [Candidatus Gracilibacteria bacterium]|nr:radical SAM protein [Candidatus Gracilibacteria bacterium]
MKLEDIGFYTLSDERAINSSVNSPLWRCELILNSSCNFKCPYCRGLKEEYLGNIPFEEAKECLDLWIKQGLKNVRFSGGEPTLYPRLIELIRICKDNNVSRIAVSTNGSNKLEFYKELIDAGVNDFSISLDGCCSSVGDKMAGNIPGVWNKIIANIKELSKLTYVSVGMVFDENNIHQCYDSVLFADSLGVSDIRVIPSAQYNQALLKLSQLPKEILTKYKILNYRIENLKHGKHVRGMKPCNSNKCKLVLDDMAVAGGKNGLKHFPCIIYLREGGKPIGNVSDNMRNERDLWMKNHNSHEDPICSKNCLDVCIAFNDKKDN